jgi:hypothetical protein
MSTSNNDDIDKDTQLTHTPPPMTKQKTISFKIYDLEDKAQCKMYTDQMGKFPKKSSRGHQYIMVLIKMDSNTILIAAMKNRLAGEMSCAYQELVDCLCSAGNQPKLHLLDNECSNMFKERIKSNNMEYQLVLPHDHRQNIPETAIKVFEAHFISILCGCDKFFPLHLWDRLLPRAKHTLNMLPPDSVCVILTSSRGGLPSDAVPTARLIHPPQCLQHHTPFSDTSSALPWEDVS